MKKEELIDFALYLKNRGVISIFVNIDECSESYLKSIQSSDCKDKTPKVITNEKAKEFCLDCGDELEDNDIELCRCCWSDQHGL